SRAKYLEDEEGTVINFDINFKSIHTVHANVKEFWLYISPNETQNGFDFNSVLIVANYSYAITWKNETNKYLPSPYQTQCQVYSGKFQSQYDCIRQCKIEFSIQHCNALPWMVNVPVDYPIRFANESNQRYCVKKLKLDNCTNN